MESDKMYLDGFSKYFNKIDSELEKGFESDVSMIEEIGKYALLGEGKRLRPLLFILSALLCGYREENIYHFSTMFEYVHCASLLHDDVIDNANTRRNRPSSSSLWGNSAAVLTGDYMSSRASGIAVSTGSTRIINVLSDTVARMTEGQFLELVHSHNWNTTRDEYLQIIGKKTAELMAFCCASGAIISGADEGAVDNLSKFGFNLGISFQMVDDLLDYVSSEEKFGKPVGKDIREGKITLPLIYTLGDMDEKQAADLEKRFRENSAKESASNELIMLVRDSGNIERVRLEAKKYVTLAAGFLDAFPESECKEDLLKLNEYIGRRSF